MPCLRLARSSLRRGPGGAPQKSGRQGWKGRFAGAQLRPSSMKDSAAKRGAGGLGKRRRQEKTLRVARQQTELLHEKKSVDCFEAGTCLRFTSRTLRQDGFGLHLRPVLNGRCCLGLAQPPQDPPVQNAAAFALPGSVLTQGPELTNAANIHGSPPPPQDYRASSACAETGLILLGSRCGVIIRCDWWFRACRRHFDHFVRRGRAQAGRFGTLFTVIHPAPFAGLGRLIVPLILQKAAPRGRSAGFGGPLRICRCNLRNGDVDRGSPAGSSYGGSAGRERLSLRAEKQLRQS